MGKIIAIIVGFTLLAIGMNGMHEEISNLVNLEDNIYQVLGD